MQGRRIGHYRVIDTIGRGGMGVVYEAEDLTLGRRVALKFLPEKYAADQTARERLQQEARAASSLNHPNICTIYGIEEEEQQFFIVMERLHGVTLDTMLGGRPLPVETLLTLASQAAAALAAAHRTGVIHRDLKPANIFVTTDGIAKVMDFGLAKRTTPASAAAETELMTAAAPLTTVGTVMGTAMYMSPEQLRGAELDLRSDLFSFGLVLHEMATGRHPFAPGTTAEFIDGILNRVAPSAAALNPELPPRLDDIIARLLEKDPALRYQSTSDLDADLKRATRDTLAGPAATGGATEARPRARNRATWSWRYGVAAGVAVLALASLGMWRWRAGDPARPPSLADASFTQLTDQPGAELFPSLSPDGKLVAYTLRSEEGDSVVVQRVGGQKPIRLADGTQPAFSPNGEQIAFRSDRDGGGIFVMGSTGESVRRLTTFGYTPGWSPDGTEIVFDTEGTTKVSLRSSNSRLWRVAVAEGEPRAITPEGQDAVQPNWSPHGQRIAYWTKGPASSSSIWTIPANGGPATRVTDTAAQNWCPTWSPDGKYLYFLSNAGGTMSLWYVAIDEASGVVQGAPAVLTASPNSMANLTLSRDGGSLAYTQQLSMGTLQSIALDAVTRAPIGTPALVTRMTKGSFGLDVSPDGAQFAFASASQDLFVMRADGSDYRQLTDGTFKVRLPRLSPDGKLIAFSADRNGRPGIWTIATDGSGLKEGITGTHGPLGSPVWSPDGRRLAYAEIPTGVFVQETGAAHAANRLLFTPKPGQVVLPWSWSPDGRKLALTTLSRDNAIVGVMVYSFDSGQVRNVTDTDGGPLWLRDSRHVIAGDQWAGRVHLLDTESDRRELLFATALNRVDAATLSADNRQLYLVLTALESDLWLLTMR